ncbi:MAG: PLDc N-terminal domain-containing protein [Actinomycetota bacterium]
MVPLIVSLVMLVTLGAWIWAIADMARHTGMEWDAAGQSPVVWVLAVVFLGPLGLILYLAIARPRLRRSTVR